MCRDFLIGETTTKEELLNVKEQIRRKLSELEIQLSNLTEEVDFLIKYPKNRIIRMKQPKNLSELKIPKKFKFVSILDVKERINRFFREYGLIKTDVNHLYSARLKFDLTKGEDEDFRDQKRRTDRLQTLMNEIYKEFDEIKKWLDSLPYEEVFFHPDDGGMTQIDSPSLKLDVGPADTSIDSVVDDLEGIVVLC